MATLNQLNKEIEQELQNPALVSLSKITLYIEIIAMIVNFIISRNVISGGKVNIKWYSFGLFFAIIGLFKEITEKLTGEPSPVV